MPTAMGTCSWQETHVRAEDDTTTLRCIDPATTVLHVTYPPDEVEIRQLCAYHASCMKTDIEACDPSSGVAYTEGQPLDVPEDR